MSDHATIPDGFDCDCFFGEKDETCPTCGAKLVTTEEYELSVPARPLVTSSL